MKIQLSDHFTYGRLLRFTLPSVVMMIFTSIYSVVDGMFVSNIVGSNALSSLNIVSPLFMVLGAFGFMLGTGGCAEVAKTLGEGDIPRARKYFSMIIAVIIVIGAVLTVVCIIFIRPISYMLGANDVLIDDCVTYGTIMIGGGTLFMLQTSFQTFLIAAERPKLGLFLTVLAGVTNMVLDYVFVSMLQWGIAGAAWATVIGYAVGGVIPLIYFLSPNSSILRLGKPKFYGRVLLKSCTNGSSEMLTSISGSVVTFLYNLQMMRLLGEDGVAAITVIMYVNFVFLAILLGFSMGVAPVIGYNYGANNQVELKSLFKKSLVIVIAVSVLMTVTAEATAVPVVTMFIGANAALTAMTVNGFRLSSLSYMMRGFNIFGSSFFTALCNGRISALLSGLRSLIVLVVMIMVLPVLMGITGVWLAVVFTEIVTTGVTVYFLITRRKRYGYA